MLFVLFLLCVLFFVSAMAHNVPAVYDVFAARIRALRSKDQGCKNVGEQAVGRSTATDLGAVNPGAAHRAAERVPSC
jgi:hypothetical protein